MSAPMGHRPAPTRDQDAPGYPLWNLFGFDQPDGGSGREPDGIRIGDAERDRQLEQVVARGGGRGGMRGVGIGAGRIAQEGLRQRPQPAPIDEDHGEDGAGLDGDVEQVAAVAQPALGDQQVAGAGDRQEFGDAFDDAQQQGGEQLVHGNREAGDAAAYSSAVAP